MLYIFEIKTFSIFHVISWASVSLRINVYRSKVHGHSPGSEYISLNCIANELRSCTVPAVMHQKAGVSENLIYVEYYCFRLFCFFFLNNLVGKNTPRFHLICVSLITASFFYHMCWLVVFPVEFLTFYCISYWSLKLQLKLTLGGILI